MNIARYLILILLICSPVLGATLTGTIYDSSLNKVSKAIVEIKYPVQRDIVDNGTYFFELAPGEYNISVYLTNGSRQEGIEETVTIEKDQNYVFDLFLFEDLSEEETLEAPEITIEEPQTSKTGSSNTSTILILGFLILIAVIFYIMKPSKEEEKEIQERRNEDDLKDKIIEIIEKEKRITQKELRKKMPYSEAKISMMITQLESEGRITKIKKGRTNIIVIKD